MGLCEHHFFNSIWEMFTGTRDPAIGGAELPVLWMTRAGEGGGCQDSRSAGSFGNQGAI